MRRIIMVAICALSLLAVASLAWAQSSGSDIQPQSQAAPPPPNPGPGGYGSGMGGPGMMGPGGGGSGMMGQGMMGPGGRGDGRRGPGRGRYGQNVGPTYEGWQSMSPQERQAWQQMNHQFQKDTLALRQRLVTKQMELETLWASPNPDQARVRSLSNEVAALQAELANKRNQFLLQCRQKFGDRGWPCPGAGAGY